MARRASADGPGYGYDEGALVSEVRILSKRFVAAAVCPQCDAVDRIVVEVAVDLAAGGDGDTELSRRRCVACGFRDEFSAASRIAYQGLPKGRPEKPKSAPVNPVKVRILDPKDPGL